MVENNAISDNQMRDAYNEKIDIIGNRDDEVLSSINYYTDAVMEELKKINSVPDNYSELGGLKIYTNFNYELQKNLEDNIKESFPADSSLPYWLT